MVDRVKYFLLGLLFLIVAGVITYDRWNTDEYQEPPQDETVSVRFTDPVPHLRESRDRTGAAATPPRAQSSNIVMFISYCPSSCCDVIVADVSSRQRCSLRPLLSSPTSVCLSMPIHPPNC